MDYCVWNTRLGDHFFGKDSIGKRVFMCVTRETLAEISDLSAEDALKDFVAALLEGPDWTRIRGCTLLETKVHCCLHIDPQWGTHWTTNDNPCGVNELQDLSSHVQWLDYTSTKPDIDHPDRYPPYLAYLAAFVLAWTERRPERRGNDYYETVLDLLDEHRERWTSLPQFYRKYHRNGRDLTINDVWKDLMHFCSSHDRAELILPDTILRPGHYVDAPKFLGLMKASDLRNLGRLFAAMEEGRMLTPEFVPSRRDFVLRVLGFTQRANFVSSSGLEDLTDAVQAQDTTLAEAYGQLLQAKYRDFDGMPDEEDHGLATGGRRRARLLRVLDRDGSIKLVCRLRSEGAFKKLPLEEEADYVFEGQGHNVTTRWVSESEWFSPVDVPMADPLQKLELSCPSLRLKAGMTAKNYIVMHSPGLHFLAGCRVEVDELVKGRQYLLLTRDGIALDLNGIRLIRVAVRCPVGMSCWSFGVAGDASAGNWPEGLPPLIEESLPIPRLCFSGFRLEPRSTRFPLGLPIRISCNVDNIQLLATGCDADEIKQEEEGQWVLVPRVPGGVTLSLRKVETGQAPQGWRDQVISLESLNEQGGGTRQFAHKLWAQVPAPPYFEAFVELLGGTRDPRCDTDKDAKTFFATTPPKFKVNVKNVPEGGLQVVLGGKTLNPSVSHVYSLPVLEAGTDVLLVVKVGSTLLCSQRFRFTLEPKITVQCASRDRSSPTEVVNSLVATLRGDACMLVDWEVREDETRVTWGQIGADGNGIWKGVLVGKEHAGFQADKTYEVRFGCCRRFMVSQWFKFRTSGSATKNPPRGSPLGGLNSLANAFKGISLLVEKKGGKL